MCKDVSVIIPVFNSEKYLSACLESVVKQTLKSIEIIIVDDGSTDSSLSIVKRFMERDDRIILIHQKNMFAGVARNNGLNIATGKYVIFLDSDDFFEPNMLMDTYRIAEKKSLDMVMFGYWEFDDETKINIKNFYINDTKKVFSSSDLGDMVFTKTTGYPWDKLINREFILDQNILFQDVRYNNDMFFSLAAVLSAKRMVYLRKRFVHYRINNKNSISGKIYNSYHAENDCGIKVISELKKFMIERDYTSPAFKKAFINRSNYFLDYRVDRAAVNKESFEFCYNQVKEKIIPDCFDSKEELSNNLKIIYNSDNAFDCLCELYEYKCYLNKASVSKKSINYRIGFICTYPFRFIRQVFC